MAVTAIVRIASNCPTVTPGGKYWGKADGVGYHEIHETHEKEGLPTDYTDLH